MTRVQVTSAVAATLTQIKENVELCDSSGQVFGRFIPATGVDWLPPDISEDELAGREREPGGRTLAEILAGFDPTP